eukprot:TRINITY_DN4244_c0_g1_i1.p1 TRINITY_DN4244_c0_g1~~TRINITY_DN4244_c0_g1_i1.p1  ORF type:complete len:329 (+),score=95.96 TRINITY_DN4244_c0_g1_i1:99-989(+)
MPAEPPRMELEVRTKNALAGEMEPNVKADFLNAYICMVCTAHSFGHAVRIAAACEHNFHHDCMERALAQDGARCPCRAPIHAGQPKFVDAVCTKRVMDAVEVLCPQGCGGVMAFDRLHAHVHGTEGCPNTPFRCGNEGCDVIFVRSEMEEHREACPHRLRPCRLCEDMVKDNEMQGHEAEVCPQRIVNCPQCQKPHPHCQEQAHLRDCTGVAFMKHIVELRGMMVQQQQRHEEEVTQLKRTIAQQQDDLTMLQRLVSAPIIVSGTEDRDGQYSRLLCSRNDAGVWANVPNVSVRWP